jgi:hypothetical protein
MPVLHRYRAGQAYYVRTKIKDVIITFQLTAEGLARLQSAGVEIGKPFNRWLLLDLYRSGDAYTGGIGAIDVQLRDKPIQEEIDFSNDPEPDTLFPNCSGCSSLDDLHLVEVKAGEASAAILCAACRKQKVDSIDTSIPLPLVSRGILTRFLEMKNIKLVDSAVTSYKDLLDAEFTHKWEALARKRPLQEPLLDKGSDPQGSLL